MLKEVAADPSSRRPNGRLTTQAPAGTCPQGWGGNTERRGNSPVSALHFDCVCYCKWKVTGMNLGWSLLEDGCGLGVFVSTEERNFQISAHQTRRIHRGYLYPNFYSPKAISAARPWPRNLQAATACDPLYACYLQLLCWRCPRLNAPTRAPPSYLS